MTRPSISSSLLAASLVVLGACAPAPAPVGYQYLSTPTLWGELSRASDTKEIMLIESELAVRGQTRSPDGTEYIGRRTAGTVGRTTYSRMVDNMAAGSGASPGNDKDCSDFSSGAAAQRFFIAEGGPTRDPHRLDGDGDGNACDWGSPSAQACRIMERKSDPVPSGLQRGASQLPAVSTRTITDRPGARYSDIS